MVAIENTPLFSALEIALNRVLSQQALLLQECATMEGQLVGLKLNDLQRTLLFAPHKQGISVFAPAQLGESQTINATIETSLIALAKAAANKNQAGLPEGMRLSGDTQLAQQFSEVLKRLEIDWEEHLSNIVGDAVAHQIGQSARSLFSWGRKVIQSVTQDAAEYVREESRQTPHPDEVEEFYDEVDDVRDAVDRFEAKLKRYESKREKP